MSTDAERVQIILDDIERRQNGWTRVIELGSRHIAATEIVLNGIVEYTINACAEYAEQQRRNEILGDAVKGEKK